MGPINELIDPTFNGSGLLNVIIAASGAEFRTRDFLASISGVSVNDIPELIDYSLILKNSDGSETPVREFSELWHNADTETYIGMPEQYRDSFNVLKDLMSELPSGIVIDNIGPFEVVTSGIIPGGNAFNQQSEIRIDTDLSASVVNADPIDDFDFVGGEGPPENQPHLSTYNFHALPELITAFNSISPSGGAGTDTIVNEISSAGQVTTFGPIDGIGVVSTAGETLFAPFPSWMTASLSPRSPSFSLRKTAPNTIAFPIDGSGIVSGSISATASTQGGTNVLNRVFVYVRLSIIVNQEAVFDIVQSDEQEGSGNLSANVSINIDEILNFFIPGATGSVVTIQPTCFAVARSDLTETGLFADIFSEASTGLFIKTGVLSIDDFPAIGGGAVSESNNVGGAFSGGVTLAV